MTDPTAVWRLIERADEYVKYARNRDPAEAYARARATLDEAEAAAAGITDPKIGAHLAAQIDRRRHDLDRLEDVE